MSVVRTVMTLIASLTAAAFSGVVLECLFEARVRRLPK
jgi:hypothetical protein